jgi:hypothetical protein
MLAAVWEEFGDRHRQSDCHNGFALLGFMHEISFLINEAPTVILTQWSLDLTLTAERVHFERSTPEIRINRNSDIQRKQ